MTRSLRGSLRGWERGVTPDDKDDVFPSQEGTRLRLGLRTTKGKLVKIVYRLWRTHSVRVRSVVPKLPRLLYSETKV